MILRKGDKFICNKTINNILGLPLFEEGKVYDVLYVDNEQVEIMVVLNHNLYANEYMEYPIDWIKNNFKFVKR
jgi:hypothetical protein